MVGTNSYTVDREMIKGVLVEVLTRVVAAVGSVMPSLDEDTRPIGALPHFDSVLAEDTTGDLYKRLGLPANLDVNPFIKSGRAASVGEVVDVLCTMVADEGKR